MQSTTHVRAAGALRRSHSLYQDPRTHGDDAAYCCPNLGGSFHNLPGSFPNLSGYLRSVGCHVRH